MRLGRIRRLHFLGIGGAGMCALAELALEAGLEVTGCELEASPRTERLVELGAGILLGHDPAHVGDVDAVVATAAVPEDLPELQAARRLGLPVVGRAELLAEVERGRLGIAVAGTHGKTTTASMITWVLQEAGLDPTAVVGGRPAFLPGHARAGRGPHLVCEADEYARAFLALHPCWCVVTNVEPEHLEVYGTREALEAAFAELAGRVPFWGAVIACADDPGAVRVAAACGRRTLGYGLGEGAWLRAVEVAAAPEGTAATVVAGGKELGRLRIPLAGGHNLRNALAAVAVALELEIPFVEAAAALARFPGVGRRLEVRGERGGVLVADDYAHHPTEIAATLAAARQRWPGRRVVAVFEPHLYSRTRAFAAGFARALAAADRVILLPVYPAREAPRPGVDSRLVLEPLRAGGAAAELASDYRDAARRLEGTVAPGDVVLTLGAGPVDRVGELWLAGEGS